MALTVEEPRTVGVAPTRRVVYTRPSTWPAYWPLLVMVVGYPLWWILGVSSVAPVVMAVPLAHQLFKRRPIRLPRGFLAWALYLTWVFASAAMLRVNAPSGVPGGGPERLLVFGLRFLWFLAATTVLLWAYNLSEREVPTRKVIRIVGWMFVVTAMGGLLGVIAPRLELTSVAQMVLPKGMQATPFIRNLIRPTVASIQEVLGVEGGRPVAPFAYTNSWGANLSMFLPFFLVGWCDRAAGWKRWPALGVVGLAIIPVVVSLNRGLWASLIVGLVYLIVRTALRGRALIAVAGVVVVLALAGPLLGSQLGGMVSARLDNPHSNERRSDLLQATVSDVVEASPVLGFGSARDYRGSFASIAGGGTPECPRCQVPPLGTQGQLWYVIFSQGLIGIAFFLTFFGNHLLRHWRSRTAIEAIGVTLLGFLMIQLLVYDTMDLPMMTVMLGIGLMERRHPAPHPPFLRSWLRWLWSSRRPLIAAILIGAVVGGILGLRSPTTYRATVPVQLEPIPVHLDLSEAQDPRYTTIDTEASMVFSEQALAGVEQRTSGGRPDRDDIEVTAAPNTQVMFITVEDPDPGRATELSEALAESYLDVRSEYFLQRRAQVLTDLEQQLAQVAGREVYVESSDDPDDPDQSSRVLAEAHALEELQDVTLSSTSAGELLRGPAIKKVPLRLELWVVSGAAIGLLVGLLVAAVRQLSRPASSRGWN